MKEWIKLLLSDANKQPSTRLHLAWLMIFTIFYAIYKDSGAEIIWALCTTMAMLAGLSVVDRPNIMKKQD